MVRFTSALLGLAVAVGAQWAIGAGSVHVNGYVRSNGTYVAPHYRSAPDGNFGNNWSTIGNVNPYTGELGTKTHPSSGVGTGASSVVPAIAPYQVPSIPTGYSSGAMPTSPGVTSGQPPNDYLQTLDIQLRQQSAKRIAAMGYSVDWQQTSASDLLDIESRLSSSARIKNLGYSVDWQKTSLMDMLDLESRISTYGRLKRLGYEVDWQHTTLPSLLDMESRITSAQRLSQRGVKVDWRAHSLSEMLSMEFQAPRQ